MVDVNCQVKQLLGFIYIPLQRLNATENLLSLTKSSQVRRLDFENLERVYCNVLRLYYSIKIKLRNYVKTPKISLLLVVF